MDTFKTCIGIRPEPKKYSPGLKSRLLGQGVSLGSLTAKVLRLWSKAILIRVITRNKEHSKLGIRPDDIQNGRK